MCPDADLAWISTGGKSCERKSLQASEMVNQGECFDSWCWVGGGGISWRGARPPGRSQVARRLDRKRHGAPAGSRVNVRRMGAPVTTMVSIFVT